MDMHYSIYTLWECMLAIIQQVTGDDKSYLWRLLPKSCLQHPCVQFWSLAL